MSTALTTEKPIRRARLSVTHGMEFGRLTVLSLSHTVESIRIWNCICQCGRQTKVRAPKLTGGNTKSCGCLRRELVTAGNLVHGQAMVGGKTKTFMRWQGILARCSNPKHRSFKNYGGRGIEVCERWHSFINFRADMGDAPDGMLIDRIDNDGNYEPGNCRWVDPKQSAQNRRPRSRSGGAR